MKEVEGISKASLIIEPIRHEQENKTRNFLFYFIFLNFVAIHVPFAHP